MKNCIRCDGKVRDDNFEYNKGLCRWCFADDNRVDRCLTELLRARERIEKELCNSCKEKIKNINWKELATVYYPPHYFIVK